MAAPDGISAVSQERKIKAWVSFLSMTTGWVCIERKDANKHADTLTHTFTHTVEVDMSIQWSQQGSTECVKWHYSCLLSCQTSSLLAFCQRPVRADNAVSLCNFSSHFFFRKYSSCCLGYNAAKHAQCVQWAQIHPQQYFYSLWRRRKKIFNKWKMRRWYSWYEVKLRVWIINLIITQTLSRALLHVQAVSLSLAAWWAELRVVLTFTEHLKSLPRLNTALFFPPVSTIHISRSVSQTASRSFILRLLVPKMAVVSFCSIRSRAMRGSLSELMICA